jgi:LCP family protein required for cell wall assembly
VNEWPSGWFRTRDPRGSRGGVSPAGNAEPTVRLPGGGHAAGGGPVPPPGGWPSQPPLRSSGGMGTRAPVRPGRIGGPPGARSGGGLRRGVKILGVVAVALVIVVAGLYFLLDSKLTRQNVLTSYAGRPAQGAGQNWLITGSDSRQGLTRKQERTLSTGFDVSGHRSDTIMVLHVPSGGGRAVLVSLPRDSYVDIPGYGMNKINAAYSFGGPRLLAKTVQNATGLRIDHYMGIGFGGLVHVVNAIGGVRMCLPTAIRDQASGLHLRAGCQTLNGAQALGFVRARHPFAQQDLQRVQNQRIFLRALLRKVTSPATMLNPFASVPAAFGAAGALTVDKSAHLYQLVEVAFALRNPETTTVPIASANYYTPAGDAVKWDTHNALELFSDLRTDQPVPKSLLSGSKLG